MAKSRSPRSSIATQLSRLDDAVQISPGKLRKDLSRTIKQHSDNEAKSEVVSRVMPQTTAIKREKMSEVNSIIEYDEDLANAEAPVPIPASDYAAVIRGAVKKRAKAKEGEAEGKEYVDVTFFIDPDQYPADYTEGDPDGFLCNYGMGRLRTDGSQKSRWGMKKFCESIGVELGRTLDLNEWLGKAAVVTIKHEEYEGALQARVTKVSAA